MRQFFVFIKLTVALSSGALAQMDPNWSQREMQRMQAEQERFSAQLERQKAEQERFNAQVERQRAEQDRWAAQAERERIRKEHDQERRPPESTPVAPNLGNPSAQPIPPLGPLETGNNLYKACSKDLSGKTEMKNVQCLVFIGNILFTRKLVILETVEGKNCYPIGMDLYQVEDIVLFYLRDNPARRHLPAINLAVEAITQAFPACHPRQVR